MFNTTLARWARRVLDLLLAIRARFKQSSRERRNVLLVLFEHEGQIRLKIFLLPTLTHQCEHSEEIKDRVLEELKGV